MSPDQIEDAIQSAFPNVQFKRRRNPVGRSFYLDEIRDGPNPARLARAVQRSATSATEFKLAVTSRVNRVDAFEEVHTPKQVCDRIAEEMRLWRIHFGDTDHEA